MFSFKKYILLLIFFIYLNSFYVFAGIIQGVYVPDDRVDITLYGSDKYRTIIALGEPPLKFLDVESMYNCYYKLFTPRYSRYKTYRTCICFFLSPEGIFVHYKPF